MSRASRTGWKPLTLRNLINDDCEELIVVVDPKGRTISGKWSGTGEGRILLQNGYTETSIPTGVEGWLFFKLPSLKPSFGIADQPKLLG